MEKHYTVIDVEPLHSARTVYCLELLWERYQLYPHWALRRPRWIDLSRCLYLAQWCGLLLFLPLLNSLAFLFIPDCRDLFNHGRLQREESFFRGICSSTQSFMMFWNDCQFSSTNLFSLELLNSGQWFLISDLMFSQLFCTDRWYVQDGHYTEDLLPFPRRQQSDQICQTHWHMTWW